jgi:hypothetical protein
MNFGSGFSGDILGLIVWAALIYAVFRLLADSIYSILRVAVAVFVAAEIIYFLRLSIDIPFFDRISWDFIEQLNRQIVNVFQRLIQSR